MSHLPTTRGMPAYQLRVCLHAGIQAKYQDSRWSFAPNTARLTSDFQSPLPNRESHELRLFPSLMMSARNLLSVDIAHQKNANILVYLYRLSRGALSNRVVCGRNSYCIRKAQRQLARFTIATARYLTDRNVVFSTSELSPIVRCSQCRPHVAYTNRSAARRTSSMSSSWKAISKGASSTIATKHDDDNLRAVPNRPQRDDNDLAGA